MSPRLRFYLGVFLLTGSTMMLEIVQTRLLSVVTWYHLAFFVISSAMFGMTAGAVWVYLRRDRFKPETLTRDLAATTTAFAITTALSLAFQVTLAPSVSRSVTTIVVFAELSLAMAIPFFFSGAAVSLALTRSPYPVGIVYAVDLAGAALGCLGVLAILEWTDAPSAILLIAAMSAAAAMLFAGAGPGVAPSRGSPAFMRPWVLCLVLVVLGLVNGATPYGLQPIVVKDSVERKAGEFLYEKWNCFSRIIAMAPERLDPALWGPSVTLPPQQTARQIALNIDGAAATTMFRFDGRRDSVSFLQYDLTNLAYFVKHSGRGAVIGVGSGRDLLSASVFGMKDVTGIEINPIFVDLLTERAPFRQFAGFDSLPGVRFIVDEARSWFARTNEKFDLIQMSMIDTWAATGAGAFTLTENGLYTEEAWEIFLDRLEDRGVFTVSRWHAPGEINETGRMMSLAVAALFRRGVSDPQQHLFLASTGPISTLILSVAPLDATQLATLREVCARYRYDVLLSPGQPAGSELLRRIVTAKDRRELLERTAHGDLDLSPPTDDRPFFFNLLRMTRAHRAFQYLRSGGVVSGNLIATLSLLTILIVAAVLVVMTIVVPLRHSVRDVGRPLVYGGTLYFALLGLGFMLVEIGLLQRLSVFLGHPVYSLSIVLFGLILATGAGSLLSERVRLESRAAVVVWAGAIALYLVALPMWLPSAMHALQSAGIVARAGLAIGVIAPVGVLMGLAFPTGMRIVQQRDGRPTPWFWGINGAAGVLASVLAVALSIAFGIHTTLFLGALCYLGLIPAAAIMQRSRTV